MQKEKKSILVLYLKFVSLIQLTSYVSLYIIISVLKVVIPYIISKVLNNRGIRTRLRKNKKREVSQEDLLHVTR